jgi:hypothetical protein
MVTKLIVTDRNGTKFVIRNNVVTEHDLEGGANTPPVKSKVLSEIACDDNPDGYTAWLSKDGGILYVKPKGATK